VIIPHCDPVSEIASHPIALIAIDNKAIETRSPEDSSISISRSPGRSVISSAKATRLSVVFPIALTTTTKSDPERRAVTTRFATR
jgi:hypothetical protein